MGSHSPSATTNVFQSSVILLLLCMLVNAYHDYCIIGAGPSGLQLGYFFQKAARDYVIYEKSNVSGMLRSRTERNHQICDRSVDKFIRPSDLLLSYFFNIFCQNNFTFSDTRSHLLWSLAFKYKQNSSSHTQS